jgi:septum formation topological specificity factor MinE
MAVPHDSPATPAFQGELAQTPLPEILVTIHRYKVPGVIECRRDAEVKRIYLDQGQIVFASSNVLADSLGDKLLREGKITREQYDESARRLTDSKKRQGVILAEMQAIEPRDLFVALREQIQEIVWSLFAWERGSVTFTPGRDKSLEFVKIQIAIPSAILQGVRRMPDPRALVHRLGTRSTTFERVAADVSELALGDDETLVLERVDGRAPLFALITTPPLPAAENARILYALLALQVIAVRNPRGVKVQVRTEGGKYGA